MYHDATLAPRTDADPRPRSAVSHGVGLAGLAGMTAWLSLALWLGMDGPFAALVNVAAAGVPMVLWSVLVDKVHRNPSTGIDWSLKRPLKDSIDTSITKLVGLWLTWAAIAGVYAVARFYWQGNYQFAMWCFQMAAPWLFALSIPYVLWIDRHLVEPRDGPWHLGAWLMNLDEPIDREAIYGHLRAWAVKGFFLAFMLAIVPGGFGEVIRWDRSMLLGDPVMLARFLITVMFMVDVAFATSGYILTMKPLDAHIRSATPYTAGWVSALICYPPFALMGNGGPLDYHPGTSEWTFWLHDYPAVMAGFGAVLVALTAIYAWATIAFGIRFSNLTHRGILTHGPYAWTRHPAYVSKNLFWWIATLPFLTTTNSWSDAIRNTVLMAAVTGVYYWRAKTEEKHLGADPDYQAYSDWMTRNGPVPRFFAAIGRVAATRL